MSKRPTLVVITLAILLFLFTACNPKPPTLPSTPGAVVTEIIISSSAPTNTVIPPTATATPVPLAAIINGEGIPLAEYQAELERFQAASEITGTFTTSDFQTSVLSELVDQTLLAQAAAEKGFVVDDTLLQSRIDALEAQLGGANALEDWRISHGYTADEFKQALKKAIASTWMRDQIIAAVPETAEQVHAFQILVPTAAEADDVYASLQNGKDFMELAHTYDPMTDGDLGWFPRGYLDMPKIDEAAFNLQVEQYSAVIETKIGYHILYLAERDPARALAPDARRSLQLQAVKTWLKDRRSQSEIHILVP